MSFLFDFIYVVESSITIILKCYLIVIAARYLRGGRWPKFQLTRR